MMEQTQLTSDRDHECLTVIPSPNPHEGQEVHDYLNENSLTIVDIGKVESLKKQLVDKMDRLKEFKEKEKKWMEEKAELKQQVTKLEFQKKFMVTQHGKMLECVRKIAHDTEFHRLKQSPSKENSNCEFEFVREELLVRLCKHVEDKFEQKKKMKKDAPICDDNLVESEPVSVPAVVVSSPKHSPTPTMSMTSGSGSSLEKERQNKVKMNLFPSAPEPCDDEAPMKPAVPKLVIKVVKGQPSGMKSEGTLPSSSDSTVASLSSWKCEKPKKKAELKKSENGSSDMEGSQIVQSTALVQGLKRKLTAAALSLPKPKSSKTSSTSSSRSGSKASKKWTCDRCSNRLDSNRQYKEHLTLVDEAVGNLKDHYPSLPVFVPKKRKATASSPTPVQVKPVFQQDEPDESSFFTLSSDRDVDMPTAVGASSPQKTEVKSSGAGAAAGAVNCRCSACGDSFDSKAVLNFHILKKHTRKEGPME